MRAVDDLKYCGRWLRFIPGRFAAIAALRQIEADFARLLACSLHYLQYNRPSLGWYNICSHYIITSFVHFRTVLRYPGNVTALQAFIL